MSLFQGLSPTARIALMAGGLAALLAAEGALLTYLSFHPPVPGSVSTSTAAKGPDVAANVAASGIALRSK